MKFNKNYKIILFSILFLAAILRLWKLNSIPPSLAPDEAALGYNAYSILKTGKDEYGEFLPVIFKSFGDYKPGLYVYLTVPFVAIFGLNEWSVRLPSAISGILTVYLIYLITKNFSIRNSKLEIFTAFAAATNPWLIHFSRGAWEANVSLAFTLVGVYFFLLALKKSKYFYISVLFFSLTLWCYQGAKLSSLIVVLILSLIFRIRLSEIWKSSKTNLLLPLGIGILIALPVISSLFQGKTGRLTIFSLFSYPRTQEYIQELLGQGKENIGSTNYFLFHSESLNFARGIAGRWFNQMGTRFLFFEGDYQNARHGSPYHGVMLLVDIILLPIGLLYLVRNFSNLSKFSIFWLVLAPLPSILSRNEVHAVRALNMAIPLLMISSAGLYGLVVLIYRLRFRFFPYTLLLTSFILSFIYFADSYFVHLPVHNAKVWYFGYKDVIKEIIAIRENYPKIIFQQSYSQPYIYYLFYSKYDPKKYQNHASININSKDVGLVENVDNIYFEFYSWPPALDRRKTLIVGDDIVIPEDFSRDRFNFIKDIKLPDRLTTAFRIVETK